MTMSIGSGLEHPKRGESETPLTVHGEELKLPLLGFCHGHRGISFCDDRGDQKGNRARCGKDITSETRDVLAIRVLEETWERESIGTKPRRKRKKGARRPKQD